MPTPTARNEPPSAYAHQFAASRRKINAYGCKPPGLFGKSPIAGAGATREKLGCSHNAPLNARHGRGPGPSRGGPLLRLVEAGPVREAAPLQDLR